MAMALLGSAWVEGVCGFWCGLGIDFGVPLKIASDPVLDTFGVVGQIGRYRIVWTRGLGL